MKKGLLLLLCGLFLFLLASCSSNKGYDRGGYSYSGSPDNGENNNGVPQAGQLTASEWSDLKNYDFFLTLFETNQDQEKGIFSNFQKKGYFDALNLVEVTVKNGDTLLHGASVELINENQEVIYASVSNAKGKAYLFPRSEQLDGISNVIVRYDGKVVNQDYNYSNDNNSLTIEINAASTHLDIIDIMFVVDTTGSMRDELTYLISEIDYVITEVKEFNPTSTINLALLFYRDHGDAYVTRYFDFTTNIATQKYNLSQQSASGGGDYEEAVDKALDEAVKKNWSESNTTKLLFHVLDAPPHETHEIMSRYVDAIEIASQKGIRIIPVASSGINKYTEYLLRHEAMLTGGTYVFLTDDSGIGNSHLDASVGEIVVEYLNLLLIRLINEYHTGIEGEKVPYYDVDNQ